MEEWLLSLDRDGWPLLYLGGMLGGSFSFCLGLIFFGQDYFELDEFSISEGLLWHLFVIALWPIFLVFLPQKSSDRIHVSLFYVVVTIFALVFPSFAHSSIGPLVLYGSGIAYVLSHFAAFEILPLKWSLALAATAFLGLYTYHELTLSPEEQLARERASLAEEKRELKDARTRVEIAKVQAERAKLRKQEIPKEVAEQIAQANKQLERLQKTPSVTGGTSSELTKAREELARLKREGVDYSKLSEPQMSSAPLAPGRAPQTPVDDQTKLILSALWLGACFFLQRVFEKLFKDKGYALLTVCAAGFLLAFFTANYFLLGGSVTGGLMGSVGDRG